MQEKISQKAINVINRLKEVLKTRSDGALADALGIKQNTLSTWKKRDTLDYQTIIAICEKEGVNMRWVFTGEGTHELQPQLQPHLQPQLQPHLQPQSENEGLVHVPFAQPQVITVDGSGKENIVFVDAKAAAGYATNLTDQVFFQKLPSFNLPTRMFQNATFRAFQIDGDSMEDTLKRGDWVFGKYLENGAADCKNGYTYVIVTFEGIVFKRVLNRVKERGTLVLQSDNPTYRPYEVDIRDIQEVWDIKSAMMFDLSNKRLDLLKRVNELEAEMVAVHSDIKLLKAKL